MPGTVQALESGVFALWGAKQTGPGTPAAAAEKMLRQVDGDLAIQRAIASVNFGDGRRFANGTDYTDTLVGGGSPVVQAQPGAGAWLVAQHFGTDAFTAGVGSAPGKHVLTPGNGASRWLTFWTATGRGALSSRQRFGDTRISQTVIEASQAQKDLRITATLLSLDAGVVYDTDPVATDDGEEPFLYTQAEGTFNIDAKGAGVVTTVSQVQITVSDELSPYYGDSIRPRSVVAARGSVGVAFTMLLDETTLPIYNLIHYGTETPAAGAAPANTVHFGSLDFLMSYGAGDSLRTWRILVPRVSYRTDVAIAGRVDGGPIEMAIGGDARINADGDPIVTMEVQNADPVYA